MSPSVTVDDDGIEADKLLDLDEGDVVEYEAYDGDLLMHDDREKRTYRKEVTNITGLSDTRVYVHVEDCESGNSTILSAATKHNRNGVLWRTGNIEETMGPHATHPDSWTRVVNDLRLAEADE